MKKKKIRTTTFIISMWQILIVCCHFHINQFFFFSLTVNNLNSYNKNCVKVYGLKKILHSYLIRYGINFQLATCKEYLNGQQPRKAIFVDESLG